MIEVEKTALVQQLRSSQPEIKASPRNSTIGFLADALRGAQSGMNKIQLPIVGGLGDMVLGGAPQLADDISYQGLSGLMRGGNVATGGIGTYGLKPETLDLAGVVTGLGGLARPVANAAGRAALPAAREFVDQIGARNMSGLPMARGQVGAVYSSKGLTENLSDAKKLAEKIKEAGFIPKIEQADGGSVYVTALKPNLTKSGSISKRNPHSTLTVEGLPFKARFADHPSYWGNTVSSDPFTGNTYQDIAEVYFQQNPHKKILPESRFVPGVSQGEIIEKYIVNKPSLSKKSMVDKVINESRPFSFLGEKQTNSLSYWGHNDYYNPRMVAPPHEARDNKKLSKIIDSMELNGWQGRPILAVDTGQTIQALTGSHRIEAAKKADVEVPIYLFDESILNYQDEFGDTITEALRMDHDNLIEFLEKGGFMKEAELLKLEDVD